MISHLVVALTLSAAFAPADQSVADLKLVEVPATRTVARYADTMAVFLTGDGGWAALDKGVSADLAARGIPVVGWSSLTYYWTARTPEQAAADLARIVTHYTAAWKRPRVILVGYSFGADVLPFEVNRLTPDVRSRIVSVALLGPSATATFEFHVAEWIRGAKPTEFQVAPEVSALAVPVLCVHGRGETDSACPSFSGAHVTKVLVGEGHHFGHEYHRLGELILGRRE